MTVPGHGVPEPQELVQTSSCGRRFNNICPHTRQPFISYKRHTACIAYLVFHQFVQVVGAHTTPFRVYISWHSWWDYVPDFPSTSLSQWPFFPVLIWQILKLISDCQEAHWAHSVERTKISLLETLVIGQMFCAPRFCLPSSHMLDLLLLFSVKTWMYQFHIFCLWCLIHFYLNQLPVGYVLSLMLTCVVSALCELAV